MPKLVRMAWWTSAAAPPGDLRSGVEEHLHQANHAGVVDLDSGNLHLADGNRKCDALEERGVDMDIEGLSFQCGKPVRDGCQCFANSIQVVE